MNRIIETVGLEVESVAKTRDQIRDVIETRLPPDVAAFLSVDRDASVEFNATNAQQVGRGLYINQHTDSYKDISSTIGTNRTVFGYEVKTRPMTIAESEKVIWNFLPVLASSGDFTHDRAAMHIHVGFGYSHKILLRLLRLGLKIDPLLYRMAGMGRKYRGYINASIYARPLQSGPTVQTDGGRYRKLMPVLALDSTSSSDFFRRYGLLNIERDSIPRYHPGRYFGLNLFSLLLHGTVEFRHFNQTLNAAKAVCLVKLCRAIVELVMFYEPSLLEELPDVSVHEEYPNATYEEMLQILVHNMKTNDIDNLPTREEMNIMMDIIEETPHHEVPDVDVITHIGGYSMPSRLCYDKYAAATKKPRSSGYIDIHNIRKFSILKEEE